MTENAIAKEGVDAAFRLHTTLGPGLLESVYDTVLAYELSRRGFRAVRQQPIPILHEGIRIDTGFRADLIVEDKVIVEVKSIELLAPVHKKQLLTYLRLADKRLGLLINFQVASSRTASRASSTDSKKILTQSRQAAKTHRGQHSAGRGGICGSQGDPCDPSQKNDAGGTPAS